MSKKIILILILSLILTLQTFAQDAVQQLNQKLMRIANALFNIGLIGAVIALVWAGYLFIGASGDPNRINQAKSAIVWTIVGVVVMILSVAIKNYILSTIGG